MQERLIEFDALSQITKEIRDRKSPRLIEELASRASARLVSELGLVSSEPAE